MEPIQTVSGAGRLLTSMGEPLAAVRYEYQVDRRNRVWRGTARRSDGGGPLAPTAGPAALETEPGVSAPINYYQRTDAEGTVIVFTGRGAPPGEHAG